MSGVRVGLRRRWRRSARYRPRTATGWIVAVTVAAYVVQLLTAAGSKVRLLTTCVACLRLSHIDWTVTSSWIAGWDSG